MSSCLEPKGYFVFVFDFDVCVCACVLVRECDENHSSDCMIPLEAEMGETYKSPLA